MELYTKKVNAHIQRHNGAVDTGPSSDSNEVEERKELLQDTIDESDIVRVKNRRSMN